MCVCVCARRMYAKREHVCRYKKIVCSVVYIVCCCCSRWKYTILFDSSAINHHRISSLLYSLCMPRSAAAAAATTAYRIVTMCVSRPLHYRKKRRTHEKFILLLSSKMFSWFKCRVCYNTTTNTSRNYSFVNSCTDPYTRHWWDYWMSVRFT